MGRLCLLALGLLVFSGAEAAPSTFPPPGEFRYTVFFGNLRPVGTATYRVDPDGDSGRTLEVSDRGRGPNLIGDLRLDPSGIRLQEHLTGGDHWQTPIDERSEVVEGRASWSSAREKGEKKPSR